MSVSYDLIVIGGGHNGLVTAAYSARAGLKVIVLERREVLGGACVTEEVWPGYKVSTAAYVNSLLRPEIIRELELARHGFEMLPSNPSSFTPFPDGRSLLQQRAPVGKRRERGRVARQHLEPVPRELELADDLGPEQAVHVRRRGDLVARPHLLGDARAAEHLAAL